MNIQGTPYGYWFGPSQYIVVRGPNDELLQFRNPGDGWQEEVDNLTDIARKVDAEVRQGLINGDPHGYTYRDRRGYSQHVVAQSPDNRLLQWFRDQEENKWCVVSLTDRAEKVGPGVGQALITTAPHGNAFTVFHSRDDEENTHHIVARSPDSRLLEWSLELTRPNLARGELDRTCGKGCGRRKRSDRQCTTWLRVQARDSRRGAESRIGCWCGLGIHGKLLEGRARWLNT